MKVCFGILLGLVGIVLAGVGLWKLAILPVVLGCYLFASDERDMIEKSIEQYNRD